MGRDSEAMGRGYPPQQVWGQASLLRHNVAQDPVHYDASMHPREQFAADFTVSVDHRSDSSIGRRSTTRLPSIPPTTELLEQNQRVGVLSLIQPHHRPSLSYIEKVPLLGDSSSDDEVPSKRNLVRRQNRAYLKEMKNAHADGRKPRHIIHTDLLGKIIEHKSAWHRAVKAIGRTEIDWSIKSYRERPDAWDYIIRNIQRALNETFVFEQTPVEEGYLEKYSSGTISKSRCRWRSHWKQFGTKHPKCPQQAYDTWLPHWSSEKGRLESDHMIGVRAKQLPKVRERSPFPNVVCSKIKGFQAP